MCLKFNLSKYLNFGKQRVIDKHNASNIKIIVAFGRTRGHFNN